MAKEMMIIFVYDTQMLQREDDDPASAILYFHPTWVSDQQKTALCGQLMGTVHCVKSILSVPKIVSLQSGKFFVKEYGRYLMAVGTDRNIADWLLEHRAKTMSSLISFFHQDLEVMAKTYDTSSKFSAKLYHLFETYLKYLFLGGNIFSHIPALKLPKSASNVFLEAIHILQCCQEVSYVLGGTLLYHNKYGHIAGAEGVVATQLSCDVTKRIVLTDPYRIKCPGEVPKVNFETPLGVQMLQVYISSKEYYRLHEEATRSRSIFQYLTNKNLRKIQTKSSSKEPAITAMKRDQSIIFTAVPEEDSDHHLIPQEKPIELQNRPKFLPLKNKTSDFNIETKTIAKTVPQTPYHGQTSVCSTPMTDLSKVVHSKPLSICINPVGDVAVEENVAATKKMEKKFEDLKLVPYLKVTSNLYDSKKFSSALEVRESSNGISNGIKTKYYNAEGEENLKIFKTIADPTYPVFRSDGTIVSHPFYEDYVTNHLELITTEINDTKKTVEIKCDFKDFDSCLVDFVKSVAPTTNNKVQKPIEMSTLNSQKPNKDRRKSLSLPLKSLSVDDTDQITSPLRRHSSGVQLTPLMSKLSTFEDRSSGFCSRDATPMFTPTQANFPFSFKKKTKFANDQNDGSLHKCVLFVCGQQDMVVTLLLQEEGTTSLDVITKLWEICTENLGKLEKQLHHCLETYPTSSMTDSDPYSYLHLDPDWDTMQRGGPWSSAELGALTYFHRDFKANPNLTEILMRCCDGVIYGYQCGKSEVFYHQPASSNAGLPTPADPLGNVSLKAKRRLERDHSIILL